MEGELESSNLGEATKLTSLLAPSIYPSMTFFIFFEEHATSSIFNGHGNKQLK